MAAYIALVGDFDSSVTAHRAIPEALRLSGRAVGTDVVPVWVPTESLTSPVEDQLSKYAAVWCVPGSPYANAEGALAAICFARESERPFLGTCGGFQHAVIEYARNVIGMRKADHAESAPDAEIKLISKLTCSLIDRAGNVWFHPGSRIRAAYGTAHACETYHCNYGVNPAFDSLFEKATGLHACARDESGDIRAVELPEHPFFVATLFQPERSALLGKENGLVTAFVRAALDMQGANEEWPPKLRRQGP